KRWKWMILVFVVADCWGMWLLSYPSNGTTLSVPNAVRYPGNVPFAAAQEYITSHVNAKINIETVYECALGNAGVYRFDASDGKAYFFYFSEKEIGIYGFSDG